MENLHLNFNATVFLKNASKWATFLAVIGFIFSITLFIAAIFMGAVIFDDYFNEGGISYQNGIASIVLAFLAITQFIPFYYLFKFANNTKSAIKYDNNDMIINAFRNLKSHFKFISIMIIITLLLFLAMAIGVIVYGKTSLGH